MLCSCCESPLRRMTMSLLWRLSHYGAVRRDMTVLEECREWYEARVSVVLESPKSVISPPHSTTELTICGDGDYCKR